MKISIGRRIAERMRLRPMMAPIQNAWITRGWSIDDFVHMDIGASGGVPNIFGVPEDHWRTIAFDPDPRAELKRQNGKSVIFNTALFKDARSIKLYMTREPQNSSIYKPNAAWRAQFARAERMDVIGETQLSARALDDVREEYPDVFHAGIDFIKLDTQGSELDILQGGVATLSQAYAVQVEVEFVQHYINQPLFSDVDAFLRQRGFVLFDIQRVYWKKCRGNSLGGLKGQLTHGDALYLRDNDTFLRVIESFDASSYLSRILKAMDMCLRYGCNDHASELFELALERRLTLTAQQIQVVRRILRRRSVKVEEPGRLILMALSALSWVSAMLDGLNKGYNYGDKYLGNRF